MGLMPSRETGRVSGWTWEPVFAAGRICNNQPMTDPGPPPEILIVTEIDPATGVLRVGCRGRLVAGHTNEFYESVRALIPGSKRIVLDFNELTHMDSSGLGSVLRLYVSAKSAGCELQLDNLGKGIRKIFSVTNVLSLFTIVGENDIRPL
jgi:anti-sigma B factor antagonist